MSELPLDIINMIFPFLDYNSLLQCNKELYKQNDSNLILNSEHTKRYSFDEKYRQMIFNLNNKRPIILTFTEEINIKPYLHIFDNKNVYGLIFNRCYLENIIWSNLPKNIKLLKLSQSLDYVPPLCNMNYLEILEIDNYKKQMNDIYNMKNLKSLTLLRGSSLITIEILNVPSLEYLNTSNVMYVGTIIKLYTLKTLVIKFGFPDRFKYNTDKLFNLHNDGHLLNTNIICHNYKSNISYDFPYYKSTYMYDHMDRINTSRRIIPFKELKPFYDDFTIFNESHKRNTKDLKLQKYINMKKLKPFHNKKHKQKKINNK